MYYAGARICITFEMNKASFFNLLLDQSYYMHMFLRSKLVFAHNVIDQSMN